MDSPQPQELSAEEKKKRLVGSCNFSLLMILSFAAVIMSTNATYFCNFADRTIDWAPGFSKAEACAKANFTSSFNQQTCNSFFDKHGVGFYTWYATIPVDQQVCMTYILFIPNVGYIEPSFDTAFNAAKVFAVMADIFGFMGWFTVIFATCCPLTPSRMAGLSCYFSLAFICSCFSFLIFNSNICEGGFFSQYFPMLRNDWDEMVAGATCSLGDGGKQAVASTVLYFVCSGLAPAALPPTPIGYARAAAQEEQQGGQV